MLFYREPRYKEPTRWCLIEGGWNKQGGWKNFINIISRWGKIAGGLEKFINIISGWGEIARGLGNSQKLNNFIARREDWRE